MPQSLTAEHGVVCALPRDLFGYFGWPTVCRLDNGALLAAASGMRFAHVCPFGRSALCHSHDDGKTWTQPRIINDSPLDDRDTGLTSLGGSQVLMTWFVSDHRERFADPAYPYHGFYKSTLAAISEDVSARFRGCWVRRSDDAGLTWRDPVRVEVSAPHGPIRCANGDLLYLGKAYGFDGVNIRTERAPAAALRSTDQGDTWTRLGDVPLYPGATHDNVHEPHVVELPDGKLIGMLRMQSGRDSATPMEKLGLIHFSMAQTESTDGGQTWSVPRPLGFHGSPPHLLRHSSGTLILSYGYRREPYGQRIALSQDHGATWRHDYILRADGPDSDLGYPSTVELGNGELLTVYYQKAAGKTDKPAMLWSRWRLPD